MEVRKEPEVEGLWTKTETEEYEETERNSSGDGPDQRIGPNSNLDSSRTRWAGSQGWPDGSSGRSDRRLEIGQTEAVRGY